MKFERIPIHKVDLDRQNPRITQFQSAEQSFDTNEESNDWLQNILLQPHGSEEYGPNSDELQKSIRAAGTIIEPVILIKDDTQKDADQIYSLNPNELRSKLAEELDEEN